MEWNVAQLLKEPTGGTRKHEVDDTLDDLDPDLVIQAPITGRVKFTKILQGILVTGTLHTEVEVNCSRCLEPFDAPVEIEIEEQFRPTVDLQTGVVVSADEDEDEATRITERNILDLSEVVRQGLLTAFPLHPLCREGCKGLCPRCGKNLNDGPCDCPAESTDSRWEALKSLLDATNE